MNSRESILNKLRSASKPFSEYNDSDQTIPAISYLAVSPLEDADKNALKARFIHEAELLSCQVHQPYSANETSQILLDILSDDKQIVVWDFDQIPFPSLASVLQEMGITVSAPGDPAVRVGITGVDAALATTGSIILASGSGNFRGPSLLPEVHIAFVSPDQILPNLESWLALQREDDLESFRKSSNIVVISGPSRTADIAMELILGMHGPRFVHLILLPE